MVCSASGICTFLCLDKFGKISAIISVSVFSAGPLAPLLQDLVTGMLDVLLSSRRYRSQRLGAFFFQIYHLSAVRMRSFLSRCTPVRRFPVSLLHSAGRGPTGPFISVCFLVLRLPPVSFSQLPFLCRASLFSHSAQTCLSLLTEASKRRYHGFSEAPVRSSSISALVALTPIHCLFSLGWRSVRFSL